ncbi:TetR/AcrR family transcriptional regulator [Acidimicrobiaceae bacterium AH-315-P05]|nr:TetR/AcrR family transcriptional regulator [Acidimicrobiaceae bacterium AH-315-P05]
MSSLESTPEPDDRDHRTYVSPLRERQARETHDAILDALTRLLEDRSADDVTTSELAREAEVSQRTVYRQFPDRAALLQGLTERLEAAVGREPDAAENLEGLKRQAIDLMAMLEKHATEARVEAVFNADPRHYGDSTRRHSEQMRNLVSKSLPNLEPDRQLAVASVVRVLLSTQTWLRMREEFDIDGHESGPIVAWALDAIVTQAEQGNPPPKN